MKPKRTSADNPQRGRDSQRCAKKPIAPALPASARSRKKRKSLAFAVQGARLVVKHLQPAPPPEGAAARMTMQVE